MSFWCSESHKAACFSVCSVNSALVTEMETSIHWANKQSGQANLLNTEVLSSFNNSSSIKEQTSETLCTASWRNGDGGKAEMEGNVA